MPEFPGGELALRKYIANAIKYPVIAQENGIQGKVYVLLLLVKMVVFQMPVLQGVLTHRLIKKHFVLLMHFQNGNLENNVENLFVYLTLYQLTSYYSKDLKKYNYAPDPVFGSGVFYGHINYMKIYMIETAPDTEKAVLVGLINQNQDEKQAHGIFR